MSRIQRLKTLFIAGMAAWLALTLGIVLLLTRGNRVQAAVIGMGVGLAVVWVLLFGGLTYLQRERIRALVLRLPGAWQVKFILFATLLALVEEAITVSLTNLAPLFGVQVGEAYITASANYLDVVLHHSVVVFVPWFIAWALLLSRYDFSPFAVFLLTGLNGLVGEALAFGSQQLGSFAMWIFVYGLMVYLPAYSLPAAEQRGARPVSWRHYPLGLLVPMLAGVLWVLIFQRIVPPHPPVHFPPLQP